MKRIIILLVALWFCLSCLDKSRENNKIPQDRMVSKNLSKVAFKKSWELLEKGQALADSGKSIAEILTSLPDSTIAQTNESAILFFIEGSVPMMIVLPGDQSKKAMTKGGGGSVRKSQAAQSANLITSLSMALIGDEEELVDVVASEEGEDERQKKKALVIAPYSEDFGNYDDGLVAKRHLEKNKNYKGRVDYLTQELTLETYANFTNYDLVHLSTHGERFCSDTQLIINAKSIPLEIAGESSSCKILVDTGIIASEAGQDLLDFVVSPEFIDYKDHTVFKEGTFLLKSSFFDHFYADGLENKIWVFSACELGQQSYLGESMVNIHNNGHFLYWENTVLADDAFTAFNEFYRNLVKEGLNADRSFNQIPAELKANLANNEEDSTINKTQLLSKNIGNPRHAIEVIEMWHPEKKEMIMEDIFYPLVGDFGDGENEALTLKVHLKGYRRSEFEEEQMSISLKVDDELVLNKRVFLPDVEDDDLTVEDLEDHEYGVELTITDISIPDVGDKEKLTLKAYLHLNDENFSIHSERVFIKASGIIATLKGSGKTVKLTYDSKTKAMRMQSGQAPSDIYFDVNGYVYVHNNSKGWMKVNFSGMMGQLPMVNTFTESVFDDIMPSNSVEELSGNALFHMVEWGIRFRMSAFERNIRFKKQFTECGKPEPCYKFVGVGGQEEGSYALFDPGGKLKELSFKGMTTTYEYGDFNVQLPNATEMSIGL